MDYDELRSQELLKMNMSGLQSFLEIEFVINDSQCLQVDLNKLYDSFDAIIESTFALMPQYKRLTRAEPSISTSDDRNRMLFSQRRLSTGCFFTLIELKTLADALRTEIEKFLGLKIGAFIVRSIDV